MAGTLFVGVEDLVLEGPEEVCARAAAWGITELAVSYAYHAARDVASHSGVGAIVRKDGIHFVPREDAFAGSGLVPDELQDDATLPARVAAAAARHGIDVLGWAVFLHHEALGARHPEITQCNVFGGRAAPADLCPSQPRVREYCTELALALADTGVTTVVAESLHYGSFGHGYHHERDMVGLGPVEQFLLGLCFCHGCEAATAGTGVDVRSARDEARSYLDARLAGLEPASGADRRLTLDWLESSVGRNIAHYAAARTGVITSLVAEVATALAALGVHLVVLDLTGAQQGYGDGLPPEASGIDEAWQIGLDIRAVAAHADVGILAYARSLQRVVDETARYTSELGASGAKLRVLLRPGLPDCGSPADLVEKSAAVRAAGASAGYYHYGLYPLPVLERIAGATL